jgi:hypothetical protein
MNWLSGHNSEHLAAIGVIAVSCVVLFAIWRTRKRVIKLDVNFDRDAVGGPIAALIDLVCVSVLLTLPKKISLDWEQCLAECGGTQYPLTLKVAGRKLTLVVDFHGYEGMGIESGRADLLKSHANCATDLRSSLGYVEGVSLMHNRDLHPSNPLKAETSVPATPNAAQLTALKTSIGKLS